MSVYLRILLVLISIFSSIYVIKKIRSSQMKIEDSFFWFSLVFLVLILSFIPNIAIYLAELIGVESPVNLVYLIMLIITFAKLFSLALKCSQLNHKIEILVEEFAIWKKICESTENNKNSGDDNG